MVTINKIVKNVKRRYKWIRDNLIAVAAAGLVASGFLILAYSYGPGWISYICTFPALLIISITALVRVNDISVELKTVEWQLRRIGLILAGAASATVLCGPLGVVPKYPTWMGSMMAWGFALTWLTTPNAPPWWKHITRDKGNAESVQNS